MAVEVIASTGLFGAIWALISGGAMLHDSIKGSIKTSKNKSKAEYEQAIGNNPYGTYYDSKGRMRLIENDKIVSIRADSWTHEWYIEDVYGNKLRNLTEENKQSKIEKAKHNYDSLHTVVCIDERKENLYDPNGFNEPIYLDIITGNKYLVRIFNNTYNKKLGKYEANRYYKKLLNNQIATRLGSLIFYMDTETGLLVRLSDSYLRKREKARLEKERKKNNYVAQKNWEEFEYDYVHAEEFMRLFNERQNTRRKDMELESKKMDISFYCGEKCNWDCETDYLNK